MGLIFKVFREVGVIVARQPAEKIDLPVPQHLLVTAMLFGESLPHSLLGVRIHRAKDLAVFAGDNFGGDVAHFFVRRIRNFREHMLL